MIEGLEQQREARIKRAEVIAERLEKMGLPNALEKARAQAGSDRPLGRPDFARALVAEGVVADWAGAFKRYLGSGKKGDVKAIGRKSAKQWLGRGLWRCGRAGPSAALRAYPAQARPIDGYLYGSRWSRRRAC